MQIDTSYPSSTAAELPVASPRARTRPQWRWWVHLCIIASYPIFAALSALVRYTDGHLKLPPKISGLLLFCALQVGVFGAFWLLAWAFSRATKDELWLRWRGGWRVPLWGFGYSIALLCAEVFFIFLSLSVLTVIFSALGLDPKRAVHFFTENQPQTRELLSSASGGNPVYRFLIFTLLSFVVAGGSEEFWRASTMAGVLGVCPASWSPRVRSNLAVGVAAVTFGIGHSYQGWTGVIATGLIGVALGAITLRHRSVWPTVIAHGFFDAITFSVALSAAKPH